MIHNTVDRRQGYATDALEAIAGYALEILGLKQLYADIASDNKQSIHLFKNAGYELVGVKKNWLKTLYGWKDEELYQKMLC